MTALKVLNVAYPFAEVSGDTAGGAEQILFALDRALTRAGHRSLVLAQQGSRVHGTLIGVRAPQGSLDAVARQTIWEQYRERLRDIERHEKPDLVHFHGVDLHEYSSAVESPALCTLHLPPGFYPPRVFEKRPGLWLSCVSRSQRDSCPDPSSIDFVIGNGVDLERLEPSTERRADYVFALGRICAEKGFHEAFEAAKLAGAPLLLAGVAYAYPEHQRYFDDVLLPAQDSARQFIGPIGFEQKTRLLVGARCLVVPSLVPETSSLVAMEALACGTPVVARRIGALPELIEHGVTGFLVDNVREMATAIRDVGALDGRACRAAAELRCDITRMTEEYLRCYRTILDGFPLECPA